MSYTFKWYENKKIINNSIFRWWLPSLFWIKGRRLLCLCRHHISNPGTFSTVTWGGGMPQSHSYMGGVQLNVTSGVCSSLYHLFFHHLFFKYASLLFSYLGIKGGGGSFHCRLCSLHSVYLFDAYFICSSWFSFSSFSSMWIVWQELWLLILMPIR